VPTSPLSSLYKKDETKDVQRDEESEEEDPFDLLKKIGEKSDNKPSRTRPALVQRPQLDGIPEVPGRVKGHRDNDSRKRRNLNKFNFPEPTIAEESTSCESPKLDQDVECKSEGSDLRSTPRDLSMEDLSSELEGESKDEDLPLSNSVKKGDPEWIEPSKAKLDYSSSTLNQSISADLGPATSSTTSLTSNLKYEERNSRLPSVSSRENIGTEGLSIPIINAPEADVKPTPKPKTPKPVSDLNLLPMFEGVV
jgi:hypothetical protein